MPISHGNAKFFGASEQIWFNQHVFGAPEQLWHRPTVLGAMRQCSAQNRPVLALSNSYGNPATMWAYKPRIEVGYSHRCGIPRKDMGLQTPHSSGPTRNDVGQPTVSGNLG